MQALFTQIQTKHIPPYTVWQYRLWSFQNRGIKLQKFLPNNQHTQRKLLNLENWVSGEVSKSAKIWLSKSIFYVKNYPNLSQFFFSLKNINLGAHFLITLLSKMIPNFWHLPLTQFSKFNNFLWVCWFLGKNLSNFVFPVWKLHNPYCHTGYLSFAT